MRSIPLFRPVNLPEMEAAALSVMRSGQIAGGPMVPAFEKALQTLIGREHVVATSDMTHALVMALRLAGVVAGDEVATVAFSCLSTNAAIKLAGADPLWIDICADTATMSVQDLAQKINPRTRAVLLYHIAGYPADIDAIARLCRERGIALIEDCNNALGASWNGKPVGLAGDFAVYSFYPNRQLHAFEGGALVCPDEHTAREARKLRRFGIDTQTFRGPNGEINPLSDISDIGWSATLSQLNAAVALAQFPTLPHRQVQTLAVATSLHQRMASLPDWRAIQPLHPAQPAYWVFLARVRDRDAWLARLKSEGIHASTIHHRNDLYSAFGTGAASLPGTALFLDEMLALPCGWWMDEEDVQALETLLASGVP